MTPETEAALVEATYAVRSIAFPIKIINFFLVIFMIGMVIFSTMFLYRFYLKNQVLIQTLEPEQVITSIWTKMNNVADEHYPELEATFNNQVWNEWLVVGYMKDANDNSVSLKPVQPDHPFIPNAQIKTLPAHVITKLSLSSSQVAIANEIYREAYKAGATPYMANMVAVLAWTETRFRNINENKKTRYESKEYCGDWGKGVHQFTCPDTRRRYKVVNPFDIGDSTRGAIRYLDDIRNYWSKRGYGEGPTMTRLMFAGHKGGKEAAYRKLFGKGFKRTKAHNRRALNMYRLITTGG